MKWVLRQVNSIYSSPCRISHPPQGTEHTLFLRDHFFSWAGHILQGWVLMLWALRQRVHYPPLKSWAPWKSGEPYRPVVPNISWHKGLFFFFFVEDSFSIDGSWGGRVRMASG